MLCFVSGTPMIPVHMGVVTPTPTVSYKQELLPYVSGSVWPAIKYKIIPQ